MQTIPLYRYNRPNGGVTVSTEKPEAEYTELVRLIADDGKTLTDGTTATPCVDTETPAAWTEIDAPNYIDPNKATDADYEAALAEMGVRL